MLEPLPLTRWDFRFLSLASHISAWSKDPSTKVGAVIVRPEDRTVAATGFNGFSRGVADTEERLADRGMKLMLTIHAEENAIANAHGRVAGMTVYVTHHPCERCASRIVQAGIARVVCMTTPDFLSRWAESCDNAKVILAEGGVRLDVVEFEREAA